MYKHADFKGPDTRDFVLDYFVEKIFVYSDKLVICCRYDDMQDITIDLKEVSAASDGVLTNCGLPHQKARVYELFLLLVDCCSCHILRL